MTEKKHPGFRAMAKAMITHYPLPQDAPPAPVVAPVTPPAPKEGA